MATAHLQEPRSPSVDASAQELSGVVIGWDHRAFSRNIHLMVPSTNSPQPRPDAVDTHHLLMTRNQAMLLASYLMRLTGQQAPVPRPQSWWRRLFG